MKIDQFGRVELSEKEAFDLLYSKKINKLEELFFDEETVQKFNNSLDINKDSFGKINSIPKNTQDIESFDKKNQNLWFCPENYSFNLVEYLYNLCKNSQERDRVDLELNLYIKHNMIGLLYYLKYLVDTMRENNIVWGIGRGSSVSSFILYLIGIHKINSIEYELDINEFLQ